MKAKTLWALLVYLAACSTYEPNPSPDTKKVEPVFYCEKIPKTQWRHCVIREAYEQLSLGEVFTRPSAVCFYMSDPEEYGLFWVTEWSKTEMTTYCYPSMQECSNARDHVKGLGVEVLPKFSECITMAPDEAVQKVEDEDLKRKMD